MQREREDEQNLCIYRLSFLLEPFPIEDEKRSWKGGKGDGKFIR